MGTKQQYMIPVKSYLEKLNLEQMPDLAEFVVKENFKHHANNGLPDDYKRDVNSIYKEEVNFYENSEVFVSKDYLGTIVGSIRLLKWNFKDLLPLQKIFGINPLLAIHTNEINNIYHIGRFAIKKEIRDINLFKQLMICAIAPICKNIHNIAFAECDSKLLRILNLLDIKTKVIGKSINYLGSETIPIALTYDGLINFYNTNKSIAILKNLKKNISPIPPKEAIVKNLITTTL